MDSSLYRKEKKSKNEMSDCKTTTMMDSSIPVLTGLDQLM